ncbi:MAG: hypothetical protein WBG02_20320 [Candidatus Acidiferrum sp.]
MSSKRFTTLFLFLLLCSTAVMLHAADTPQATLLVLSKGNHALFLVNPATLAVEGQIPSGPDPHEVIADADGKIAYISNYGGGAYNTITPADLIAQKALPAIDLGPLRGPHGLDFTGGKLWFTAEGAKVVGSYDPATQKIDWVLGTGQDRTHMIFVFPDLKHMITSNVSSATMTFIEQTTTSGPGFGPGPGGPPPSGSPNPGRPSGPPRTNWSETVVSVGHGAEGFDVSPDARELWAANAQDGTISIIDIATKKVTQTLDANVRGANRLKFTPDGKLVFVSTLAGPDLSIFDAASRKAVKRIKISRGAAGILMEPGGTRAFVSCSPDDYVAVINVKSLEMVGKISAGKEPDGLAWALRK